MKWECRGTSAYNGMQLPALRAAADCWALDRRLTSRGGTAPMTLVLAICTPGGVVLAADSRVGDGAGHSREDDKIWELPGGYGVVTYGCGPPGVPHAVSSFLAVDPTTEGTARGLANELTRLPRAGDWGFFMAGHDSEGFTVAQGLFPGGQTRVLNRPSADIMALGSWVGGSVDPSSFPLWRGNDVLYLPTAEVVTYALALLRHAGAVASDTVGPPYRALVVSTDGVAWIS